MKTLHTLLALPAIAALVLLGSAIPTSAASAEKSYKIPATDDGLPGSGPIRRYDWFKNLWQQRREAWATRINQDQGALVFLGDSITQGWGDSMGGHFAGFKLANRGISGDTTRGVLIRLEEDVLRLNPSGIVLLIGTNDLEEQAEPETIASNLKLILSAIKAHNPKLPVVLCEVFPSSTSKKRPADSIKKINQLYARTIKGDPQITLVQTWPLFANAGGDAKPEEFPDLLHPNAAGYAKWAAAIRPVLATLGFVENAPDQFEPEPGFTSLFNGKDLTGWGYKTNSFDGHPESIDGRYRARFGRLIVKTPPEGSKVQQIWTTAEFPEDFTLKLEFRATPNADSGIFIRGHQLQCRDYPLAGPYKNLKSYKPQDWNEIIIEVKDGFAKCTCNGEVLEAAYKVPANGRIGLEGDSGQMEYRRIRIKKN